MVQHNTPPSTDALRLLSVSEAAELLGMSERWTWAQIKNGKIATVRLGTRRLIRRQDLEAFVNAQLDADFSETRKEEE